jgi:hypothetical protein
MTNTTTTPETEGQPTTDFNAPWSLHFDRDGTEDYGIIRDSHGNELVASHLPSTRIGDRTFETGTFWLPEYEGDTVPLRVRQMQLMKASPRLLQAAECALADLEGIMPEIEPSGDRTHPGWETIKELQAAIADGKGLLPARFAIEMDIGGVFERLPEDGLYDTRARAEQAIKDHITNCINAVEAGDLDDSPDPTDFRVVEVIE